jgi:hypothetical protein
VISRRTRLIRVALFCAVVLALAPLPATAAHAAKATPVPCWVTLLNDSYDGTISNIYPLKCYPQAIKHIPAVARIYGSVKEEILQAEHLALLNKLPPQTTTTVSSSNSGPCNFLCRLVPGNPNSFPTPLIVLGLLAILLIIAGIAGMLWQRSHPRDDDDFDDDGTPQLPPGDDVDDDGTPQLPPAP